MRARNLAVVVATAGVALLAGAAPATATVSLQVTGATIRVTGTNVKDTTRVRYLDPVDGASPGYTYITDLGGISDPLPAGCFHTDSFNTACEDGGTAPLLTELVMDLGPGGDEPSLEACFNRVEIDAGEDQNVADLLSCPGGSLGFAGGGGFDTLRMVDTGQSASGPQMAVTADLGPGPDSFVGGFADAVVRGGPGNDRLNGGEGDEQMLGEDGDDIMQGRGGDDALDGGAGSDRLGFCECSTHDADPGADDYRGGPGSDTLHLDDHPAGMAISTNETADDGVPGERDNVHDDFERIVGTGFDDTFAGGPGTDTFEGDFGDDTVAGGGGNDDLRGDSGNDRVLGNAGDDRLSGGHDDDTVEGGAGADSLYGDLLQCTFVSCPQGNDRLLARDGERDTVQCGAGADSAQVDGLDLVSQDGFETCEAVDRQTAAAPLPPPPPPPPCSTPACRSVDGALKLGLVGVASVARGIQATVTCPAACTFSVSVGLPAKQVRRYRLGRKALTIGTVRGRRASPGTTTVKVRLSAKARRRLRRAKKVPATLTVRAKDAAGKATTTTQAIVLRR